MKLSLWSKEAQSFSFIPSYFTYEIIKISLPLFTYWSAVKEEEKKKKP